MKALTYSAIALAAAALFAACDDDHDDNPVIAPASEFALNTPTYVNQFLDLGQTDSLDFSWSQPSWGFPVVADYTVELSKSGDFITSYAEQIADESGETKADYYQFDVVNSCRVKLGGYDFDKAIAALSSWEGDEDVPAEQDVYVRIMAVPKGKSVPSDLQICSNVVKLSVRPYYVVLKNADPEMWYLLGSCIGDGKWTIAPEALGVSNFPMSIVSGSKYDSKTGKGTLVFNGYLTTEGFKIVSTLGSGDGQFGMDGGAFVFVDKGNPGNIVVPSNGYYTIKLDNQSNQISMEPYAGTPAVYPSISISGDFNGWAVDDAMTPFNTVASMEGHNHLWSYNLEVPAGGTKVKFLTTGSWNTNWGGSEFPYGVGVSEGGNISVPEGNYIVTFNDVDGSYAFTAK